MFVLYERTHGQWLEFFHASLRQMDLPWPFYMKVSVRGCFSKDFQFSLWPGKKYAPAMPVI